MSVMSRWGRFMNSQGRRAQSLYSLQRRCIGVSTPNIGHILSSLFTQYCMQHQLPVTHSIPMSSFSDYVASAVQLKDVASIIASNPDFTINASEKTLQWNVPCVVRPYEDKLRAQVASAIPPEGIPADSLEKQFMSCVPHFLPIQCGCLTLADAIDGYVTLWWSGPSRQLYIPVPLTLHTIAKQYLTSTDGMEWESLAKMVEERLPGWLDAVKDTSTGRLPTHLLQRFESFLAVAEQKVYTIDWEDTFRRLHEATPATGYTKSEFFSKLQDLQPNFRTEMLNGRTLRQYVALDDGAAAKYFGVQSEDASDVDQYRILAKDVNKAAGFERDVLNAIPIVLSRNAASATDWVDFEEVLPLLPAGARSQGAQHYSHGKWLDLLKSCGTVEYAVKIVIREKASKLSRVALFVDGETVPPKAVEEILKRLAVPPGNIMHTCVVRKQPNLQHTRSDFITAPFLDTYMAVEAHATAYIRSIRVEATNPSRRVNAFVFVCSDKDVELYQNVGSVAVAGYPVDYVIVSTPTRDVTQGATQAPQGR